jgi:hypothetical protein
MRNEEHATAGNLFEGLVRIQREHRTRRCSRQSRLHFCPLRLESSARATMPIRAGKRACG